MKATAVTIGCFLLIAACRQLERHDMQLSQDSVQFALKVGPVTVDSRSLEAMKETLQRYVNGPDFPAKFAKIREQLRTELPSAAVWIQERQANIGLWTLENRDGRLVLVHYPPPREGTMYLYIATLEPLNPGWKVVNFEVEREMGPA
jgi:hypothetical protein